MFQDVHLGGKTYTKARKRFPGRSEQCGGSQPGVILLLGDALQCPEKSLGLAGWGEVLLLSSG